MRALTRFLLAAYLIQAGVLLAYAPWTAYWEYNRFVQAPMLAGWLTSPYVRGAITGVGVVTALAGLRDLIMLLFARAAGPVPPSPGTPAP